MTYLEYAGQLVNELRVKKADLLKQYDAILNTKGYLAPLDARLHLLRVKNCNKVASKAEYILKGLLDGSVAPFDQVD